MEFAVVSVHRRDPAATAADHDDALLDQHADRADLEDALRLWARDDAAVMVAVGRDRPALLPDELLRLGLGVDRADGLGRVAECRVFRVDLDHRQQRGQGLFERQQVAKFLFDDVTDHRLGLGAEHVERIRRHRVIRGVLQGQQPDLRAVAVGDDDLVARRHCRDTLGGHPDVGPLILRGHRLPTLQQCVAAQGDDDPHGRPLRPTTTRGRP